MLTITLVCRTFAAMNPDAPLAEQKATVVFGDADGNVFSRIVAVSDAQAQFALGHSYTFTVAEVEIA